MTGFERSLARRWVPRAVVGPPYVVAVVVFGLGLRRAWVLCQVGHRARWHAILQLNTGQLEHLIDRQRYRNATLEYPGQR